MSNEPRTDGQTPEETLELLRSSLQQKDEEIQQLKAEVADLKTKTDEGSYLGAAQSPATFTSFASANKTAAPSVQGASAPTEPRTTKEKADMLPGTAASGEVANKSTPSVFAFEVWIPDAPWGEVRQVINERTLGRAKCAYWRDVRESWESIPYTAVRGRKVGSPQSSPEFLIGVGYRGIPDVRCGERVTWKNGGGVIVGFGGGGAWLQVIADAGWRGYVHPAECTFERRDEATSVGVTRG